VLAAISAVQFAIFDNQFISGLNFIFLTVLFIYWTCLSTGRRIAQGFCMSFMNFFCCATGLKKGLSERKKGKSALALIIGVLVFLPLIAAVINLLMSADHAFEIFMFRFHEFINLEIAITYIGQFVFGIPVAFYLYGLIYGNAKGRHEGKITSESLGNAAKVVKIAPKLTIYSALTAFNIIYLVFFAVQAVYLFSAFAGNLPETFTYAEYARRGFFELCTVTGINLFVLTVSFITIRKETDEEPKALRAETVMLSVFTILLIATALSKMGMYINAYGLTQLRVFTSWFMVLLLIVFLIICARQFVKFNSAKSIITGFIVMFMVLSYGNADGLIAKYNIGRYEAGTLSTIDIEAISELSDAAVPYIYDLYIKTSENEYELRQNLASAMEGVYTEEGFRGSNLQKLKADEIRGTIHPTDVTYPQKSEFLR